MGVLKIFGTKALYFTMLYKLTKMNVFFDLSLGVAEILFVGYQTVFVDGFFTSSMVEELFLLNQGNSLVIFS